MGISGPKQGRGTRNEEREHKNRPLEPRPSNLDPAKNAIGVFGGTFDPVHNGHLRIALDALELLGLDEVRLIPLARAVHREQPDTPASLRLEMLQAAVADRHGLIADDRELRREGPSYTIDTLRSMHADFPDRTLCLLLGSDAFDGFLTWHDPEGILALANLAILERPGHAMPREPQLRQLIDNHRVDHLQSGKTGQITTCPVTQLDIASSDIRRRLTSGRGADFLLPDTVLAVIQRHTLYSDGSTTGGRQSDPVGL